MSTELTIPSKVIPKPTRAEMLDALTSLEIDRRKAKMKEEVDKKEEMRKELEAEVMALHREAEDKEPDIRLGSFHNGKAYGLEIHFSVNGISPALNKKLATYHALRDRMYEPDKFRVRKEVAEMLSGAEPKELRVQKLLSDKDSRAALESILKTLHK